jgi:hypothetical protein
VLDESVVWRRCEPDFAAGSFQDVPDLVPDVPDGPERERPQATDPDREPNPRRGKDPAMPIRSPLLGGDTGRFRSERGL